MHKYLKIAIFYSTLLGTLAFFWFWMSLPSSGLITLDPSTKIQCLSYAPFGKEESPMDFNRGLKLSAQKIDNDLALLSKYTGCIRTYSTLGLEMIPGLARKHGLKMWLGAWVGSDPVLTQKEINATIALARAHEDVVETVVVGNEALLRADVSPAQLSVYLQEVKKALPHMRITYADVWEFWNKNPGIAGFVDRVTVHILPYWEDKPVGVEIALLHVKNIMELMQKRFPEKEVVIGETGWPSFGRMREAANPSPFAQALFTRSFVKIAEQQGWHYNYIEAFDQPWKRMSEGAVGGYWGLFDAHRVDKHVLHGDVSEAPHAKVLFLGSVLLSFLGLVFMLKAKECECKRSPFLLSLLFLGSIALVWQAQSYWMSARNLIEAFWACLSLGVALIVWLKLVRLLITQEAQPRGSMHEAMSLLFGNGHFDTQKIPSIIHFLAISILLVMALGLAFDGRYHMFDVGVVGVIALGYVGFCILTKGSTPNGFMERVSGLILCVCALKVLLDEGLRNTTALFWVVCVVLIALRLSCFKINVRKLWKPFITLLLGGFISVLLRDKIYVNSSLIDVCALDGSLFICQVRALLGKIIYLGIIPMAGFTIACIALVVKKYWLGLLAMFLGLFCLLTFQGFSGAIVMVLGWWVVGYRLDVLKKI